MSGARESLRDHATGEHDRRAASPAQHRHWAAAGLHHLLEHADGMSPHRDPKQAAGEYLGRLDDGHLSVLIAALQTYRELARAERNRRAAVALAADDTTTPEEVRP